jgi:S-DNA-T family DNA segregation ATPase FtsK/SpoIIIE
MTAHAATRLVLTCNDATDYAAAGLDPRAMPAAIPGRGVRVTDSAEFQIAVADPATVPPGRCVPGALRLRALPSRIALSDLPTGSGCVVLGVGGDGAEPVAVDLAAGSGRLLVVGPPGSGRTSALITVLHQALHRKAVVAAPRRSALATAAARHGLRVLETEQSADVVADVLRSRDFLIVDDIEAIAETEIGDALTRWVRDMSQGMIVCAAARTDTLAVTFRGLGAELRRARFGLLLQPGPVDGELFGIRLPRARAVPVRGRGVLVPDPAWSIGAETVPIQLAVSPCADTCDPSAERRSP